MMGKSHMMIGSMAGLTVATPETLPLVVIAGVVGSISPDIDHTGSTMGKALFPISWIVSKIVSHRGFTHSLSAIGIIAAVVMLYFNNPIGWAFILGYSSHIFADMMTPAGCALVSPISNYKFRLMSIRTGSFLEPFMATIISIALLAITIYTHEGMSLSNFGL